MLGALQYFLIPLTLIAVAVFLALGIYSLARGGEFAQKNSNKLMRARVTAQAIAVAVLMIFAYLIAQANGA